MIITCDKHSSSLCVINCLKVICSEANHAGYKMDLWNSWLQQLSYQAVTETDPRTASTYWKPAPASLCSPGWASSPIPRGPKLLPQSIGVTLFFSFPHQISLSTCISCQSADGDTSGTASLNLLYFRASSLARAIVLSESSERGLQSYSVQALVISHDVVTLIRTLTAFQKKPCFPSSSDMASVEELPHLRSHSFPEGQ